ncbi:MAG: PAS domain-containing protein, partial [Chitinispirillaceae bacterium]|nr:PAS domain-containing protein [Chitinispirillaceae bacterium]
MVIPVMVIGWFTGEIVKGLIVGFMGSFIANSIIFSLYYNEPIFTALITHQGIPGSLMVTFAGGVVGYLSNIHRKYKEEILSRKKIQSELEKAKERIEHILRTIPSAVFLVDKEMRIKLWNRTAEVLTGLKEEEVLGKKCIEIWYCKECEKGCGLQNEEIKKPIFGKELEICLKDGRKITIVKNVDTLLDENGNFEG